MSPMEPVLTLSRVDTIDDEIGLYFGGNGYAPGATLVIPNAMRAKLARVFAADPDSPEQTAKAIAPVAKSPGEPFRYQLYAGDGPPSGGAFDLRAAGDALGGMEDFASGFSQPRRVGTWWHILDLTSHKIVAASDKTLVGRDVFGDDAPWSGT